MELTVEHFLLRGILPANNYQLGESNTVCVIAIPLHLLQSALSAFLPPFAAPILMQLTLRSAFADIYLKLKNYIILCH
jgi:hypothetical protein